MPSSAKRLPPLLIHVGYHKTGTTWLQRILFRPEYGYRPIMDHEDVFRWFLRPHGLDFDEAATRAHITSLRGQGEPGLVDVISSEILVGNPHFGGRESDAYARRLHAAAPDARILITLREQLRSATSEYMQYISRAGTMKPTEYFDDAPIMGYAKYAPEHLEYHRLIGLYRELFGAENVIVMTQEALAKDGKAYARRLAEAAGVTSPGDLETIDTRPMSPSPEEFAAPILRRINHFRSGPTGPGPFLDLGPVSAFVYRVAHYLSRRPFAKRMLGRVKPVTAIVHRRFTDRYLESNRQLKAMLGDRADLASYPSEPAGKA
ncbi:sulfotransferase [Phenylobacterium sp.]|uniref:sulfotransferase n=1 Tax=Phenylobacterium sp. TaxID=1871053 RepID=UPI0025D055EE|nr:sulfotransferase [Phenylobacterium sp.]MBX3486145.1 sulfotransferase [Phenylobacterium sp.]